jgi:CBS domain-containing protein
MQARDIMSSNVVTVREDTLLAEAALQLTQHDISGLPVVNAEGALVGIFTERDVMLAHDLIRNVVDIMTRDVITVEESTSLTEITDILLEHRIKRVPVVRGDRLVGMVSRSDVIRGRLAQETREDG